MPSILPKLPRVRITADGFRCLRCNHAWITELEMPAKCPGCQRYDWWKPADQIKKYKKRQTDGSLSHEAI